MKDRHSQAVGILELGRWQQSAKLDTGRGYLRFELVEDVSIQAGLAIAIEQPDVRQKVAAHEFLLSNDVECPLVFGGELPGHGQLASDLRPRESIGGLYLHKPFAMVGHLDEEVGDDVAGPGILHPSARRGGRAVEELNLKSPILALPRIPDCQRLLLDVEDLGTRYEDDSCGRFELPLAADRSALLRTGHQQKRSGRATPKAERG